MHVGVEQENNKQKKWGCRTKKIVKWQLLFLYLVTFCTEKCISPPVFYISSQVLVMKWKSMLTCICKF